jgi:hypothetical protein
MLITKITQFLTNNQIQFIFILKMLFLHGNITRLWGLGANINCIHIRIFILQTMIIFSIRFISLTYRIIYGFMGIMRLNIWVLFSLGLDYSNLYNRPMLLLLMMKLIFIALEFNHLIK